MTRYLSGETTVLSEISTTGPIAGTNLSGTGTVSGVLGSFTTVSVTTVGGGAITSGASVPDASLWVSVGVSGLSVGIESGGSLYWINSTTSG
jgi:hypothetical protein